MEPSLKYDAYEDLFCCDEQSKKEDKMMIKVKNDPFIFKLFIQIQNKYSV